jgi:signal transduction histidine kinase
MSQRMKDTVELLSRPVNFAVVQLPGRNFPGVVVQGDTLNGLVQRLGEMAQMLERGELDDLAGELSDIREQLSEALANYDHVCAERGIPSPYPKSR